MALVVFLRGVNVGGHRRFRPSLLAKELSGYEVVNVGAAGAPIPFALPPNGEWLVRVLAAEGRFVLGVYRRHMRTIATLAALTRFSVRRPPRGTGTRFLGSCGF